MTAIVCILVSVVAFLCWLMLDLQIQVGALRMKTDILQRHVAVLEGDDDPDPGEDQVQPLTENVIAISRRAA